MPGSRLPRRRAVAGHDEARQRRGLDVGVYNVDGELRALEDRCSHDDGPLCEGDWDPEEGVVVCPRHGSNFDIRTGKPLTLPAFEPVVDVPGPRRRWNVEVDVPE